MPEITYVQPDGTRHVVDVPEGTSVMRGARNNGIEGIVAECGGSAMCATCHVYVDESFADLLPPVSAVEDAMLDSTVCERSAQSRLSCQLKVTPALAGLVVKLPESQV